MSRPRRYSTKPSSRPKKEAISYIEEITTKIGDIYAKKDPEKAEQYYKQSLELKGKMLTKKDVRTFIQLGIAMRKQGRWRDAIMEYQKAREVSPDDEHLLYNYAMAFAEGRNFDKAERFLKEALEISDDFFKDDPVVSYNIGLIFAKNMDYNNSKRCLEYALKLDPNFDSPKRLLASIPAS